MNDEEKPYLREKKIVITKLYNPNYGDQRTCKCGHPYERHFDSYEEMDPVGCKYCACYDFIEDTDTDTSLDITKILEEPDYDPGMLHEGGKVEWWKSYIRIEVQNCNAYWRRLIELYL